MTNYPLYEHPLMNNIRELLEHCANTKGDNYCFQYTRKKTNVTVTYRRFLQEVRALGSWLFEQGYEHNHIALLGENSYYWLLSYFAITCGANVAVPIDKELDADSILTLLLDSESKIMIYSDTYADIVAVLQENDTCKTTFISMSLIEKALEEGIELLANGYNRYLEVEIKRDTLATIVYTSGTTGRSKGVMLTHFNFMSNVHASIQLIKLDGTSLLVLPLHHTFGLMAGVFVAMSYGSTIFINKSLRNLLSDFEKCQPQNMFAVPMIIENIYKNIWSTAKKQGKDKLLRTMINISNTFRRCKIDLRKIFFKSVINSFGGNIEVIVSGGAPINDIYIKEFDDLGITILNGYGITECGPVVSVNRNRFNLVGSVGIPLQCNEVKIADDGEVLVKGTNVMQGYYHQEEENAKVFTDGWFMTGDIGNLGKYGELYITGRKKNLIILSNGENVSAEVIEKEVATISYVKEVIAYGENGKIVAEVYLDEEYPEGREQIYTDIQEVNQRLPQHKNIGNIIIRDAEFPKTTTKKIKRNYKE